MEKFQKLIFINIANRIKKLRNEKSISQQNAFNDTGIHFARIEQGKRDINITTLSKICAYFEISFDEFFNKDFNKIISIIKDDLIKNGENS